MTTPGAAPVRVLGPDGAGPGAQIFSRPSQYGSRSLRL